MDVHCRLKNNKDMEDIQILQELIFSFGKIWKPEILNDYNDVIWSTLFERNFAQRFYALFTSSENSSKLFPDPLLIFFAKLIISFV